MKVFAISDLHLSTTTNKPMDIFGDNWENHFEKISQDWKEKVSEDDLVLIAGDISWSMTMEEAKGDLDLIAKLPGKKVMIKGNHEYWWHSITKVREILSENMYAIQNDSIRFGNLLLCGTRGWTAPEPQKNLTKEDEKLYKREVERLKLTLASMTKIRQDGDKVICMMHYPPLNERNEGSDFTKLLEEYNVDICVYGHIHTSYTRGKNLIFEHNNVKYYQTSCDQVNFKLVEIL